MFDTLSPAKPDAILAIMQAFREDPRAAKIDVSVGVYKDALGATPIMRAIRAAEPRLYDGQTSKTYLGVLGDLDFVDAMRSLAFGDSAPAARIAGAQTPGGSGALRMLADLICLARPGARLWAPNPTWANHIPLLGAAGLEISSYRYVSPLTGALDFEGMLADLESAQAGDVVLLHGCCHNPTGVDLSHAQWDAVVALVARRGLFPLVDLAYLGLGEGLDEDAYGLRALARAAPEMAAAVSCSKNFSVYRERVGAAFVLARAEAQAPVIASRLGAIARTLWSMPPDHGAAICRMILRDEALRADWAAELGEMRANIFSLRALLADALTREAKTDAFHAIRAQKGMFSRLALSEGQAERMRRDHGVYLVPDGRINIAGLNPQTAEIFARAFAATR